MTSNICSDNVTTIYNVLIELVKLHKYDRNGNMKVFYDEFILLDLVIRLYYVVI